MAQRMATHWNISAYKWAAGVWGPRVLLDSEAKALAAARAINLTNLRNRVAARPAANYSLDVKRLEFIADCNEEIESFLLKAGITADLIA
jgi:hypothetical protein